MHVTSAILQGIRILLGHFLTSLTLINARCSSLFMYVEDGEISPPPYGISALTTGTSEERAKDKSRVLRSFHLVLWIVSIYYCYVDFLLIISTSTNC